MRAALVSVNLFSLLCDGNNVVSISSMGVIKRYGGPIVYLFFYGFILLALLVWADSGSVLPRRLTKRKTVPRESNSVDSLKHDVDAEAETAIASDDLLRVLGVSKTYNGIKVVDDVTLGVSRDTLFALLGPNGAGKTTTFNLISTLILLSPHILIKITRL